MKEVKNSNITITHPWLCLQWHPTKNENLKPDDFTYGSDKKIWWKCDKGTDHEWDTSISHRTIKKSKCPICCGQKAVLSNCLATLNPELTKQWHPTKNGTLTPWNVTCGSGIKVWWKCNKADDHEWEAVISSRVNGCECSCCNGKTAVNSNCLSTTHPDISKQWHSTKNGNLKPEQFTSGSNKKVWWKCDKIEDHEWETSIINRTKGHGCSCCDGKTVVLSNCLATTQPEIAKQWHQTLNGQLTPYDFTQYSETQKIWWKCDKVDDHIWEAFISTRTSGKGCACCEGRQVVLSNCLATTRPDLCVEWHSTKNGNLTPFNITEGCGKKVWWKCDKADDHEWESTINNRNNGNNCHCCSGQKVVLSNCLATTHPKIVEQWHPTKNGDLTPFNVTFGTRIKVWWKCPVEDDHIWNTAISNRTVGDSNCPCCCGQKVCSSNCLATTHPKIAEQWHPTKNRTLTPFNITHGTHKKVWWKCPNNPEHEWLASISNRTKNICGRNCPTCNESQGEKTIKEFLQKNNFTYIPQYKLDDCRGIRNKLPFDFAVFKNEKLFCLIEFNGIQHYESTSFGCHSSEESENNFEKLKKNDIIKIKYCESKNILLIQIPYLDFNNIEKILIDKLSTIMFGI